MNMLGRDVDNSDKIKFKICYSLYNPLTFKPDLISSCYCKGSVKYNHSVCLKMGRLRGKNISEVRRCEQSSANYRIADDRVPHYILVGSITLIIMSIGCFLRNLLTKSITRYSKIKGDIFTK